MLVTDGIRDMQRLSTHCSGRSLIVQAHSSSEPVVLCACGHEAQAAHAGEVSRRQAA